MRNTPLIDETDLAKNYPLPFATDVKRVEATIRLTQKTKLRDLLGEQLFDAYCAYVHNEEYVSTFEPVAEDFKMLLCLYVAEALYKFYYTDADTSTRDFNMSNVRGDVKFYEILVMKQIQASPALSAFIGTSEVNDADVEPVSTSGIWYPN